MEQFTLTIDDGPSVDTLTKLDFLDARGTKAIWFCIGKNIKEFPEAAREIIRRGHILANHSFTHPHFRSLPFKRAKAEVIDTEELITSAYADVGVVRPKKYFRFPYGERSFLKKGAFDRFLAEQGFESGDFVAAEYHLPYKNKPSDHDWLWSFDVREWTLRVTDVRKQSIDTIVYRLDIYLEERDRSKKQIILIHDHPETGQYFPALLEEFFTAGISFGL